MATTSLERVIRIDRWLELTGFRTVSDGAFAIIEPQPRQEAEVVAAHHAGRNDR